MHSVPLLSVGLLLLTRTARTYDNGLALTPQMGWNTWNHFGCGISEDTILRAAQAVVQHNLTSLGYECEWLAWFTRRPAL